MNPTRIPIEEVAEATTVQPEGDLAQPGACREHLEPVEVAGRRPEPLTGPCQGGPIRDLAREQHHPGSHGPRVLSLTFSRSTDSARPVSNAPHPDHQPLATPAPGGWTAACLCGWTRLGVHRLRAEALITARYSHDQTQ